MDELSNIASIGGNLVLWNNNSISNIEGFSSLNLVEGSVTISQNSSLCQHLIDTMLEQIDNDSSNSYANLDCLDNDGDGVLTGDDCDPASTIVADDMDCDGVLTGDDCDDSDSTMPNDDSDCDGVLTVNDCEDSYCFSHPTCFEDCTDGIDNEGDGLVDCDDDECWGVQICPLRLFTIAFLMIVII